MAQLELLQEVKVAIRATGNSLDDGEIVPLIEAAKATMRKAGIVKQDTADAMIRRAIVSYCKAHFGYDNPEAERFERTFESIKNMLSQLSEYTRAPEGGASDG